MGVIAAGTFFKKLGLKKDELNLQTLLQLYPTQLVAIDVMGTFYSLFMRGSKSNDILRSATYIAKQLIGLFSTSQSTIQFIFDGAKCQEKVTTIRKRQSILVDNITLLERYSDAIVNPGQATLQVGKNNLKRKRRLFMKQVKKITFLDELIPSVIDQLKILKQSRNINNIEIIEAPFEAEVYASSIGDDIILITNDSDGFFHANFDKWVTLTRNGDNWMAKIVDKTTVYGKLGLVKEQCTSLIRVLGIVSGNDYVSNTKGYGLTKNLAILKKLIGSETKDPQDLLKKYVIHVNDEISKKKKGEKKLQTVGHFNNAFQVFISKTQTPLTEKLDYNARDLKTKFDSIIQKVKNNDVEKKQDYLARIKWETPEEQLKRWQENGINYHNNPKTNPFKIRNRKGDKIYRDVIANPEKALKWNLQYDSQSESDDEGQKKISTSISLAKESNPKKEAAKKVKMAKSGRKSRNNEKTKKNSETAKDINWSDRTKAAKAFDKQNFGSKSFHAGVLPRLIKSNNHQECRDILLKSIEVSISYLNLIKEKAWAFIQYFIEKMIEANEFDILNELIYSKSHGNGATDFFRAVISLVRHKWKNTKNKRFACIKAAELFNQEAVNPYFKVEDPIVEIEDGTKYKLEAYKEIIDLLCIEMDTAMASLFKGRLPQLKEKVCQFNNALSTHFDSIEDVFEGNCIVQFYIYNSWLPMEQRFESCPSNQIQHSYVLFTEEALCRLFPTRGVGTTVERKRKAKDSMLVEFKQLMIKKRETAVGGLYQFLFGININRKINYSKNYNPKCSAKEQKISKNRWYYTTSLRTNGLEVLLILKDTRSKNNADDLPWILHRSNGGSSYRKVAVDPLKVQVKLKPNDILTYAVGAHIQSVDLKIKRNLLIKGKALKQAAKKARQRLLEDKKANNYIEYFRENHIDLDEKDKANIGLLIMKAKTLSPTVHYEDIPCYLEELELSRTRLFVSTPAVDNAIIQENASAANERQRKLYMTSMQYKQDQLDPEDFLLFVSRNFKSYEKLSLFYNSKKRKRNSFYSRQAKQSLWDSYVNQILEACLVSSGNKANVYENKRNVNFAIGDANFGNVDESSTFNIYLKKRLESLGYRCIPVDEYNTSQCCPGCTDITKHLSIRVKRCSTCKKCYHRDSMAGENMVKILKAMLMGKPRPAGLSRPVAGKVDTAAVTSSPSHQVDIRATSTSKRRLNDTGNRKDGKNKMRKTITSRTSKDQVECSDQERSTL